MRRTVFLVVFALLGLVPVGSGSPVEGPSWARKRVPAGSVDEGGKISEPGTYEFSKVYAAGQRACVIVIGDHKPVVDVEIKVFDARNNLIVQDRGQAPAQDFAAVMWYPPRQETYRVAVHSYGKEFNECSIAIK
jgi:hypothetical protein